MYIFKTILYLCLLLPWATQAQEIIIQENFSQGIPTDWEIRSSVDRKNWYAKNYKNDYYINMSAFGGQGKPGYEVKAALHTPLLNLSDKLCKLRFSFADAYSNGQPLEVYISHENFTPIKKINSKYWKDLVNNPHKYDNQYEATAWIPLPQIHQPYRISLVYNSQQEDKIVTTTIQLNDLDVWCVAIEPKKDTEEIKEDLQEITLQEE